jgi:hypothetical protein
MKLLIMHFSPASPYFPLGQNIPLTMALEAKVCQSHSHGKLLGRNFDQARFFERFTSHKVSN